MSAALTDESLEFVVIERIADRAVADAIVARRIVDRVRMGKLSLCRLHARKVEIALLCGRDGARDLLLRLGGHRVEGASRGSHSSALECARALGEAVLDLADDGSDLRHIVNLSVEHGARLVLHALGRENVEQTVPLLGNDADDTACADIERKDKLRGALMTSRMV